MKNPAPPPPGPPQAAPRRLPRNIVPDGGVAVSTDMKENVLKPTVNLQLNLPNGAQITRAYDGRKALMDLLVEVCGHYHLNPAYHTLELLSSDGQPVAFKPNAFLGSLDVACALIKERVVDEKLVRKPVSRVPEKTVRLVVNYQHSQKTVVRVSPLVPLHALVPVICQKCEFDPTHVLLLRDSVSRHELDLNKSLADLEIRELYALDQSLVLQPKMASAPALNYAESTCSSQTVGTAEKKGLLGFFKFNRRKSKTDSLSSDLEEVDAGAHVYENTGNDQYALSSVSTSLEARPSTLGQSQSVMNISKLSPKADLKKRRAPAPPTSQSYSSLDMHASSAPTSSLLKKRKAPAPPPTPASHTPTPTPTPVTRNLDDEGPPAAPRCFSSTLTTPTIAAAAAAATATAVTTATVVLPPVAAVRRITAHQDDAVSQASGSSSEESERAAALGSSSSSQADSVPSSHLDEVAISSQDEEEEYEDVEEEDEEEELEVEPMEMELQVLQQLQQRSREQFSQAKPVVVVERPLQQPEPQGPPQPQSQTLTTQALREHRALEPQLQQPQPQPQPATQQPQVAKAQEQQPEEQPEDSERSTSSTDSSSTISLRIDESDNNRHSAIDAGRQPPVKPRRTPLGEQTPSASPALVDRNSHNASPDSFTDMPQHSWLHSSRPGGGADVPVDSVETGSVCSSSGSFADQGYAASDGTAEDPCPLGSPSDLSPPHVPRDVSSDSDEGCATWNSRTSQKGQSGKIKDSFDEDPKLMAQLQLTLADLDAELAEMNNSSESPSGADDVIPVSVVDLVPVTTIDEVPDSQLSNSQNKNNNATLCAEPVVQTHVSAGVKSSRSTPEVTQEVKRVIPASKDKAQESEPHVCESKTGTSATSTKPPSPTKSSSVVAPPKPQPVGGGRSNIAPSRAEEVYQERCKITQVPASRFGTKTFTIVPSKVAVPSGAQAQGSVSLGAIKIDEQGNMVKRGGVEHRLRTLAELGNKKEEEEEERKEKKEEAFAATPLSGKAKAFWTSTDKQETQTAAKTAASATAVRKYDVSSKPAPAQVILKPVDKPQPKPTVSSSVSVRNTSSSVKDGGQAPSLRAVESRPPSSEPPGPTQKAQVSAPDARDLSFLKPQKRTSSQYMATALSSKFTVRPAARADGLQEKPEPGSEFPAPVPAQKPSVEIRAATTTFSVTSAVSKSSNGTTQVGAPKESGSGSSWSATRAPPGYRSHTFTKHTSVEPPRPLQGGAGTASEVDLVVVNGEPKHTTRAAVTKPNWTPKPTPIQKAEPEPEPVRPVVLPDPNQVSLFGPVKKFRPVIQKSAEKDTSLHSSLMEAIQSGDGKERLKKVSTGSGLKKPAPVEEENSHSALLSAIRANNSGRLKKTRSEAARELNHFRAAESEQSSSQTHTHTSSPGHTSPPPAPPPPPAAAATPPPPPPPAAAPPPHRVALVSAGNPEQTREALLEAIRTGAGAKALKKVPVATKTVQVNGRLGTMKASCSLSQS